MNVRKSWKLLESTGKLETLQCFRWRSTEIKSDPRTTPTTVEQQEIKHMSSFWDKWWDTKGQLRALHSLNPLRVQLVREGLANAVGLSRDKKALDVIETSAYPLEGISILDVGCGGGILSEPLSRLGAQVTGLDVSEELIKAAKAHATLDPELSGRLSYVCDTIENIARLKPESFDAVVASEVVEHVANKELFIKCCVEALKPCGSIFITTLNKSLPSWLGGIIVAEYILKLAPMGTHDWNKFISPDDTRRLLESCGCKTKLIHGMFYNPLANEWHWTASTAISYGIHAVKKPEK